jgi:nicotinate-nucleotide adenylyltransferase
MSQIAIFGGSFDPPHIGHMYNIQTVLNSGLVDEVWVVPADDGRYDKPTKALASHRKKMVELALADFFPNDKRVSLNSIQLDNELKGAYTIDLLDELEKRYPKNQFFFIIGTENASQLPTWRSAERLISQKKFLAVRRPGAEPPENVPACVKLVGSPNDPSKNVSSTSVRESLKNNQLDPGVLCARVRDYISSEHLYR